MTSSTYQRMLKYRNFNLHQHHHLDYDYVKFLDDGIRLIRLDMSMNFYHIYILIRP
jgi:hypothetical protein